MEVTRVDRWLWAVRVYKTRSAATEACRAGHVDINGASAKAASLVHPRDRVTVRSGGDERRLEVVGIIDKRVAAPVAATCMIDHSPPRRAAGLEPPGFVRDPASGRPTKRDRRQLDRLRGR